MTIRIHGDKIEFPDSTEQTTAASSIWSDVDGDAVLETDGKKVTVDANVAELGAKARITTDTGILELKVGSGDLADMVLTDSGLTVHGVAFNISDLPDLPDTVRDTDEIRVQRDGVDYKTTVDKLS